MRIDRFLGIAPAVAPMHLPTAYAQQALNCYSDKGYAITPTRAPSYIPQDIRDVNGNVFTGKPVTLWRSGDVWVAWNHWVHVCPDPRRWGSPNAFLFVDEGRLWRCSDVWIEDKSGPRPVGVPRPDVYPQASVGGMGREWSADPGSDLTCASDANVCEGAGHPGEPRSYMFTLVNDMDEESAPSNPSPPIIVPHDKAVIVMTPEDTPVWDGTIRYRWYRTLSNGQDGDWLFVCDTTAPVLIDTFDALQLGDPLDTSTHYPPPADLAGVALVGHATTMVWNRDGNIWAGCNMQPHAYPPASKLTLDHKIVTVRTTVGFIEGSTSTEEPGESRTAYVLTDGSPYLVRYVPAVEDKCTLDAHVFALDEPCVAPWAATIGEGACFYASDRGMVRVATDGATSILDKEFSQEYWSKWQPSHMKLGYERGVLFGFGKKGGWVLPISEYLQDRDHILSRTTVTADAVYCSPQTQLVLAREGNTLLQWRGSEHTMQAVWHSMEWQMPEYWNPGVVKVDADIHSLRSAFADKAWLLYQNWVKQNGACSGHKFWDAHPELQDARGFVNYMLHPIVVEIYREGKLFCRKTVVPERPFRLPRQGKGIYWSIKIYSYIPIYRVMVVKGVRDLASPITGDDEG